MSSKEEDPLTDRENMHLIRKQKYGYTDDREDNNKTPSLSARDEEKEFAKILLKSMQYIAREIKEMRMDRYKESPKGFNMVKALTFLITGVINQCSSKKFPNTLQCLHS